MALLRGWFFDHLSIKLVALLLAMLVYLNVYLERESHLTVAFPLQVTGVPDSLALAGKPPSAVTAELAGTGKQLLKLQFLEPRVVVDLAGQGTGRMLRHIRVEDLPLPKSGEVKVTRLIAPEPLVLRLERRIERRLPVHAAVAGEPARGFHTSGRVIAQPESVTVSGPASDVQGMERVELGEIHLGGRRDTVMVEQAVPDLGPGFRVTPPSVRLKVPLQADSTRVSR